MKTIPLIALLILQAMSAQQPDSLSAARKLYESAEYARALATLEGLQPGAMPAKQARDRLVYQALCLLALERQPALDAKLEEIVRTDPFFIPGPDVSPRLAALVSDARRRLLPSLVEAHYRAGKERFDARDHAAAVRELTMALRLAQEAGGGSEGNGTLEDVALLAEGFRDLAQRALEAPPPPKSEGVAPPVAIQQDIPAWPASLRSSLDQPGDSLTGILEIAIAKNGSVGKVTLVRRIHPVYDALLIAAAKAWKDQPATLNGEPIDFVKRLNVKVSAR